MLPAAEKIRYQLDEITVPESERVLDMRVYELPKKRRLYHRLDEMQFKTE